MTGEAAESTEAPAGVPASKEVPGSAGVVAGGTELNEHIEAGDREMGGMAVGGSQSPNTTDNVSASGGAGAGAADANEGASVPSSKDADGSATEERDASSGDAEAIGDAEAPLEEGRTGGGEEDEEESAHTASPPRTPSPLGPTRSEVVQEVSKSICDMMTFSKADGPVQWSEGSEALVTAFVEDSSMRLLCAHVNASDEVVCGSTVPTEVPGHELAYFVREENAEITSDNFGLVVASGTIRGGYMDSLLRMMSGVYVPLFLDNSKWPDSVKKEFSGQLHKFMAYLTDATHQMNGHTVLYVPSENLKDVEEAAKDKDLVQRLETALIHWTRQVKDVLNNQDTSETAENTGPLEEIEFWQLRCSDLSGITEQLNKPGVRQIQAVLEASKSSYLGPFLKLSKLIQDGSVQAQSNLKFLYMLKEPCEQLAEAEPREITPILPHLLNCIRIIWANSEFYNSKERLTGLLRKVSNEIINRCCTKISLNEIFDGNVYAAIVSLQESIECGDAWKRIYSHTCAMLAKQSTNVWNFDQSSIFAQIDAFVQRCRDLLEVCEGQIQFARKSADGKTPIPSFGGVRGPEIAKSLVEIEVAFERNVGNLRLLKRTILDVKATRWHDDYNHFKQGIKDLEVMMQNVITSAFESVTTVEAGVQMLDIFRHLAKREAIKRSVDKKVTYVFQLLIEELNQVKKTFDVKKRNPDLMPNMPRYAGAAHWARQLRGRIDQPMGLLNSAAFLSPCQAAEEARKQHQQLSSALEEYMLKTYDEWVETIDQGMLKRLENTLMCRNMTGDLLEVKFDKSLQRLFAEVQYWEKLRYDIPYAATEIYCKKEELRVLREHVLLVVRDYNSIITALSPEERHLFRERIRFLDRKVNPGVNKLNWASKGITDYFVRDCRMHCQNAQAIVNNFKEANKQMQSNCKLISETLLVHIQPKRVYSDLEFEEEQRVHREAMSAKLQQYHAEIVAIMQKTYEVFQADGYEVQNQWQRYMQKIDKLVEDSLRLTVKRSLQELSRAINGDGKTALASLFKVNVVLERREVLFAPTMKKLEDMVNSIALDITRVIAIIPHLTEVLSNRRSNRAAIADIISDEEDTKKVLSAIKAGMSSNKSNLQSYLKKWDKYKEIWDINKNAFIKRYANLNPPLSHFDGNIARYSELANNVGKEETITNTFFLLLDCSPLKSTLVGHCNEWQKKFTSLLNNMAWAELKKIHKKLVDSVAALRDPPSSLENLGESLNLLYELQDESPKIEQQFGPLHEKYEILEKYEVPVEAEELQCLGELEEEWAVFKQCLVDSETMLQGCKEKFKTELLYSVEEFGKVVNYQRDDFLSKGPFDSSTPCEQAQKYISSFRDRLADMFVKEGVLRNGLEIFKIEQPAYKAITDTERDLDMLDNIWALWQEWETEWNGWKAGQFATLDTTSMDEKAARLGKKVHRIAREAPDWEVVSRLKERINQFKRTMPLIQDLKNPAMRERHWHELVDEVQKPFDPFSDDFTLEKIVVLGLDQFADKISNISGAASKELSIEEALASIEKAWSALDFDIVPYKEGGHYRMRSTDDVFTVLEDNQVTLSTMKASRYVKAFEKQVDQWERALSQVMETVEMVLLVQRQWMYLENIFTGEDIRKQLPVETTIFDSVNTSWKRVMTELVGAKNVLKGSTVEWLLPELNGMNEKLEQIQKSLDMYLETKRQIFPRFYFLSNDDLLEILGQSKNPQAVQVHLKKCFDNIKSLELALASSGSQRTNDALGMHSSDGEYVNFHHPVVVEGPVEMWLCEVETTMRTTLRRLLMQCLHALRKSKRDKWMKEWAGQLLITASQITWTNDCVKALATMKEKQEKNALKQQKKKQISFLNKLSEMVKSGLSKLQRAKCIALITIEIHSRDVIDRMIKAGVNDVHAFEWLSQMRFYWDRDEDDCLVAQTNAQTRYGYEYLGNSGRLVITPLTDRCYMTLTTALHLHRGGSPQGPAGTGKTETVKDLGKALATYVIVINCSEGLDYKSMGRMFSGLAQTGAWACFDEFNRINIEVLSVVAQQVACIMRALTVGATTFMFEGKQIRLVSSVGIFITMNPGYAGRTELPDNLKSLFRPVAMMVPDSAMIAEIILFGQGFSNCKVLAKKVDTLYKLATQQLSRQDHYDFGLRALVSLLMAAGGKKRASPDMLDEIVVLTAMYSINMPKLTAQDTPLFKGIVSDLFPAVEVPSMEDAAFREATEAELKEAGLQLSETIIQKVAQLYDTKVSRHACMVVGNTGSGKTVVWQTLQHVLTRLHRQGVEGYNSVKVFTMNPKALSLGELYGEFDLNTNEWTDGVLSNVMRVACADEKPDQKWLVLDGPVDTLWIESMNSVMDDNKVLTLINGERIALPEQVSLLFEVESLAVASPATISRCGMVYMDAGDLGIQPLIASWIAGRKEQKNAEQLAALCERYVEPMLRFRRNNCHELIVTTDLNAVLSLTRMFDSLGVAENGVDPSSEENFSKMTEMWFVFSLIWSIGGSLDEESRRRLDNFLRELDAQWPSKDTVYDYYVDTKKKSWSLWEDKISGGWRFSASTPFYKIMVPTVDTVRYDFILRSLMDAKVPVAIVGPVGTGKTSVARGVLSTQDTDRMSTLTINMSAATSSNGVQNVIESCVEKRTKDIYVPTGGKNLITFMDDFNMPAKDEYGSQPPLELIKHWVDYGFWYDRQKQSVKYIKDMQLLVSMGPPGGGRSEISARLQSRFNLINMAFPTNVQIKRIFGTMINQKLQDFEEDIKPLGDLMTDSTIEMYQTICATLLPTPAKMHYLFNLRDISKVFQGLLRAHRDYHDTKDGMLRLWVHECFRVFSDRLVDDTDKKWFSNLISTQLSTAFQVQYTQLCPEGVNPVFGDFMESPGDANVYVDLADFSKLKKFIEEKLEDYNMEPGNVAMDLVPFRDAIEHLTRIIRVVRQPRGNMFLIGIGGSGRQSLSKLAAYVIEYQVFSIEITKHYGVNEFHEDLKKLYWMAGVERKPTVFLLSDTQVVHEAFLEDVNNILSSGEVPNLYLPEDMEEIKSAVQDDMVKEKVQETGDSFFRYFIERVRANLHIVLCMSPVGEPFKNRVRMYPSLVNCTTIDWFTEWPSEALLDVANKYLEEVDLGPEEVRAGVLATLPSIHRSVSEVSRRMLFEVRRHNYVTPTNYLELVAGYKKLLAEKRKEVGDSAAKLSNGLSKLDDTRVKVEAMSIELEETKKKVAEYQKECEEYLVVIVQQKREADDQQKTVAARSEKIALEEQECRVMAEAAQEDLDEAIPALNSAMTALESLNKKDMTEIKSYGKPPALVETVMQAVMVLRKSDPSWAEAKRQLGDPQFIKQLINYNRDNMSDKMLQRVSKFCDNPDFQPEIIGRVSLAAKSLCMWVRAMEVYGRIFRVVAPKKEKLRAAEAVLEEKQKTLSDARAKLAEVTEKMEELKRQYDEKLAMRDELRRRSEETELKLSRASKLVSGLAGERDRWEISIGQCEVQLGYLPGDCLVAAACLSYGGPFPSEYRQMLVEENWLAQARALNVPCNPEFDLSTLLAKPVDVRHWQIKGLPSDSFSTENGVMVTRGQRWPLMVDPQGQATKWVKNMEGDRGLKVIDLQQPDFLRTLENAIQFGTPVLLQNVLEELDPSLSPVLNKAVVKQGGRLLMRLGDKEIEYSPEFKFYITTKLANPHYTPEISTKVSIVNFSVKQQGLEAQLLGTVVRKEKPELEEQKDALVVNIAAAKQELVDLEDKILHLLSTAQGSLLDNEELIDTLQSSKVTSEEITEQLKTSEQTEAKIDAAREGYRSCAQRASILFFVLNDMGRVDPMYQFSLDAYVQLFLLSINKSQKSADLSERITNLNEYHTYAVYRSTCRGLFEKHKLLFSFQMCAKILESMGKLPLEEYNFFLRGGVLLDHEGQPENPCPSWITEASWDNITELDKLSCFTGLVASFEQYSRDWLQWFEAHEPETAALAGEWDNKCNELQRMLIVRSLRPDRVVFMATSFIINNLGAKFVEPPPLDVGEVLDDSTAKTPLIFVLSPGEDPLHNLNNLVKQKDMQENFHHLSLGQGQAPIATQLLAEGMQRGHWVFLANCHLSISWMPDLAKIVEELQIGTPHENFRLWLSSSPHPDFPISILQCGIKMTTEPPKGLKANMMRLYSNVSDKTFNKCQKPEKYKKLLMSLCYFHSVLLERRKFQTLGWNVPYDFNDSDFEVCENLLCLYLDDYEETPWDALKYLIAEANYGGRVTDDHDRRILHTYINDWFCEAALNTANYKLSSLATYYIPDDGDLQSYKDYVHSFPNVDKPEAFGQHPNADVASQIRETRTILDTLLSLQPQVAALAGKTREDTVLELAADILKKLPDNIPMAELEEWAQENRTPLTTVLLQESARYNKLLDSIRNSLVQVERGIKGLVVMSSELEEVFHCLFDATVPPSWGKAYPSLKSLASWTRDMFARVEQFATWAATKKPPNLFWMSAFTFPTGFLTAVLQTTARANAVAIDSLSWEFSVLQVDDESAVTSAAREGVYIRGLYLEGAGWDNRTASLVEPRPMELVCSIPPVHFRPVEGKKKSMKGMYVCPCYYYPVRASTPGIIPSFVISVDLKCGVGSSDHWVRRGTALLMSLEN